MSTCKVYEYFIPKAQRDGALKFKAVFQEKALKASEVLFVSPGENSQFFVFGIDTFRSTSQIGVSVDPISVVPLPTNTLIAPFLSLHLRRPKEKHKSAPQQNNLICTPASMLKIFQPLLYWQHISAVDQKWNTVML